MDEEELIVLGDRELLIALEARAHACDMRQLVNFDEQPYCCSRACCAVVEIEIHQ